MKKIYTTSKMPAVSNLKNSCSPYGLSFIKTLSLVSVAAFLSNASPVSACDVWGNVDTYFGGGTKVRQSIAPTYVIDGKVYRDVGSAFSGVGSAFVRWKNEVNTNIDSKFNKFSHEMNTTINNKLKELSFDQFVKQNSVGTITIGANKNGYVVDFANNYREARFIIGVRDGGINPTSDQAVNGSQLYRLGAGVAESFGGGAGYVQNGKWISPTFIIKAFDQNGNGVYKVHNSVASAFAGISDSFINIDKKIENVVTNVTGDRLVKQDNTGLITIGGKVGGTKVSIANSDSIARTFSGVHAGSITATSTDAINGSQFYAMSNEVASYFGGGAGYKDGNWSAPTFTVKVFDKDGKGAEKKYQNVADAFTGVNTSFANLDKKIENVVINGTGDSLIKQDTAGLITIGGKVGGTKVSIANSDNAARTLSGVNAGSITAISTDAINGSQLYSMSNLVASYFGGGAGYKDGNWSAPTFTVKVFDKDGNGAEKKYQNVADAFTGVSSSFTNLDKKIENIVINGTGDSLIKQDTAGLITIGGKVGGTKVSIANSDNTARTLSGVNAGSITALSTDAINGSQLYSMSNEVASYFSRDAGYNADGKWNAPTFTVKVFDKNGSGTEMRYENVADALSGVSSSFTNLNQKIENVTGDSFIKQNGAGLITIGGSKGGSRIDIANSMNAPRILSGVKGGAFTKASTEAVNGGQLYFMSQAFASYFGGGAGYDEKGNWSGPTFTVKAFDKDGNEIENKYTSVADAFAGVNSAFTSLQQQIENIDTGIDEKRHNSEDGDPNDIISEGFPFMRSLSVETLPRALGDLKDATTVTVAAKSPLKQISFMNSKGESRRLFDIAAGEISEMSTDAVTGSQIYLMNNQIATYFGGGSGYKNGKWISPTFTVKVFDKDGNESEKNYTSVADAFAGVNSTFTALNKQIVDIKDNAGIGETGKASQKDGDSNDIVTEGFPFTRMLPMTRMLPIALDEMEDEDENENENTTSFSPGLPSKRVSFMNSENESRRLFGISAGEISETSTDAVTGSQLYSMRSQITRSFGGGAGYNEKGEWKAPTFMISQLKDGSLSEMPYNDVASAFAGMNKTLSSINDRVSNVEQKVTSNVASNGLPWNKEKGAYDASHNGADSKITHVADGEISKGSKEVVNGGQLWTTNDNIKKVEKKVDVAVSYGVDKNGKKTNSITLAGGNESEPVLINNVARSEIVADSKYAVNGGQLHDYTNEQMKIVLKQANEYTNDQVANLINDSVNQAKSYTNLKFEALSYDINNVRKEARQAAAIGLAVSNLRYFDDPGSLSISFGGGLWRGQSAFAIGAGYTSEDGKIRSNLSATTAEGQWGVGGGITLKLK
ncbi:YadA-like family protein [Bartonella tribocorum]|nr:YadA-like family protein [Bartonella tribocorum]